MTPTLTSAFLMKRVASRSGRWLWLDMREWAYIALLDYVFVALNA